MPDEQWIPVIHPDGREGEVPAGEIQAALRQGFRLDPGPIDQPAKATPISLGQLASRVVKAGVSLPLDIHRGVARKAAEVGGPVGLGIQNELSGSPVTSGESAGERLGRFAAGTGPAMAGTAAAMYATAGKPAPVRAVVMAFGNAAGEAFKQIGEQMAGGTAAPKTSMEAAKRIVSAAAAAGLAELGLAGGTKLFQSLKPSLVKAGAQLIKTTSAVPEKYGRAILNNPGLLTLAPTLEVAQKVYRSAVKGMAGAREYLEKQTGDLLLTPGSATDIVNGAIPKLADKTLSLEEALAARQSTSFLLSAAKYGNPEQRANFARLISAKDSLDNYLESGIPGFKQATKTYFEANARDAFSSLFPQNKNMSANALRGLGALAGASAASLLHAPGLIIGAIPFSPLLTGYAIRGAHLFKSAATSPSAAFAARVAMTRAGTITPEAGRSKGAAP